MEKFKNWLEKIRELGIEYIARRQKEILFALMAVALIGGGASLMFVNSIVVMTALFLLWIPVSFICKLSGKVSVAAALVFLSFCPALVLLGSDAYVTRGAVVAYMFLSVGVIQLVIYFVSKE